MLSPGILRALQAANIPFSSSSLHTSLQPVAMELGGKKKEHPGMKIALVQGANLQATSALSPSH